MFCNLDRVSSATPRLHERFMETLDKTPETEDRSNKLLDVETQLKWLREIGFDEADCYWKLNNINSQSLRDFITHHNHKAHCWIWREKPNNHC